MPKKKKYQIPKQSNGVQQNQAFNLPKSEIPFYNKRPYFSFKYLDDKKFDWCKHVNKEQYILLLKQLKRMSEYTWKDILNEHNDTFHAHPVSWDVIKASGGFNKLPNHYSDMPVFQFKGFKECRIFGLFNEDNIFKIFWIDPKHTVYDDGRK